MAQPGGGRRRAEEGMPGVGSPELGKGMVPDGEATHTRERAHGLNNGAKPWAVGGLPALALPRLRRHAHEHRLGEGR